MTTERAQPKVVVDASVAAKWVFAEEHSDIATAMFRDWVAGGVAILAPALLPIEAASFVRTRVLRHELTTDEAQAILSALLALEITYESRPDLSLMALTLANALNIRSVYDCHYLALAVSNQCEVWTADRKMFDSASGHVAVRWIEDYAPPANSKPDAAAHQAEHQGAGTEPSDA